MKLFFCGHCGNTLYFENNRCMACNHPVGFHAESLKLLTLNTTAGGALTHPQDGKRFRYCANSIHGVCNWLVEEGSDSHFCPSCSLNKVIPNLSSEENLVRWRHLELAKQRLVYSLLKLNLPFYDIRTENTNGLQFEFLSNELTQEPIVTGHRHGLITINIEEADEIQRLMTQLRMGEKYRTLLGHFRHEVGHFYWDILIRNSRYLDEFRYFFGDESINYNQSLNDYYRDGPPEGWHNQYISQYASSHPWEDWAETWANYLHLMDTLETAWSFGIDINPVGTENPNFISDLTQDPYEISGFRNILKLWLPLTFALNNLNRSMGHPDFYSFYLSPVVMDKLGFIHKVCGKRLGTTTGALS